jgi:hypothetical protein
LIGIGRKQSCNGPRVLMLARIYVLLHKIPNRHFIRRLRRSLRREQAAATAKKVEESKYSHGGKAEVKESSPA